jgi:hypothetical protein
MPPPVTLGLVGSQRRYLIRKIFLRRRATYTLRDVSRLTRLRPLALRAAIADGEVEATNESISWEQVAALAIDRWGIEAIEADLGDDAAKQLPPLVRAAAVTLGLPRYQVAMLSALRASGADINAIAADLFLNLAEERAEEMEQSIPGFRAAMSYPDTTKETS